MSKSTPVMRSKVHIEGSHTVPVSEAVEEIDLKTGRRHQLRSESELKGWLRLTGLDGPVLIPFARIMWVSTIPEVAP